MKISNLAPQYESLTMNDVLRRYTGPSALPIPGELVAWVECAVEMQEIIDLGREVAAHERARRVDDGGAGDGS